MKMARVTVWRIALMLALLCAESAWADCKAGQHAWDAGRPHEALAQWWTATDTGDGRAMLARRARPHGEDLSATVSKKCVQR